MKKRPRIAKVNDPKIEAAALFFLEEPKLIEAGESLTVDEIGFIIEALKKHKDQIKKQENPNLVAFEYTLLLINFYQNLLITLEEIK